MIRPNFRRTIRHSAKGSTWDEHKYVKRIDGTYYYPSGYEGGRTVDSLKDGGSNSSESDSSSEEEGPDYSADDVESLALEVIRGNFGNGQTRKDLLGGNYEAIQKRVNELMKAGGYGSTSMSSVSDLVVESGTTALKAATKKVTKTQAEKGVDFNQIQSVYRSQSEREKKKLNEK